jgi:cytochrome c oxidase subunit 2
LDSAEAWQLGFQDPATPIHEGIIDLHNDIMWFIVLVVAFVCWAVFKIFVEFNTEKSKYSNTGLVHGTKIEVIWTVIPSLILLMIAIPSFSLLYSIEEIGEPSVTLKVIGRQWYWSYEYSDYNGEIEFDSYMVSEDDLEKGSLRLLEVDNRVVLPIKTQIRLIITAADVIHCWGIPSLGIKCDGTPGRLNEVSLYMKREGVFYGQCSELCGVNHGFMPIVVEGVKSSDYMKWIENELE